MLLSFHPRVAQVDNAGVEPVRRAGLANFLGQGLDGELLGELVEDAVLALRGGMLDRQPDAGHRVADIQEAAGVPTLAVDGQRKPDRGLDADTVEHGAPDRVVVEAGTAAGIHAELVGVNAVDYT